jgi:periplasmic divalent cation tolerance protein
MPTAYVTAPRDVADDLAERLVREEFAACVNLVDCRSVYRWEGDVVNDDEAILLAKTTDEDYDELADFVERVHPHDVPCVERFDEADVAPEFGAWIRDSVA